MQPKMIKPRPIKKPSSVMTFKRKVKSAVIPVAFINLQQPSFQASLNLMTSSNGLSIVFC